MKELPPTRKKWSTGADLVRSFQFRKDASADRMAILGTVWERELGHMARHWTLAGVKKGVVFVKAHSSAAAQELHLRAPQLVRNLNKHFSRAWIKGVRAAAK